MKSRFIAYPLCLSTRFAPFSSPGMHADMVRDSERSLAFERALRATVESGMRVLDLGAGTGILGLWALQAGAAHLDAIDASEVGSALAQTFSANGVADRARAHNALSTLVNLPERADLVVAEILGHYGIDEGILESCHDAAQRLAKADAIFIPAKVRVVAWPIWAPDFEHDTAFWQSTPYGFDLSAMAPLARQLTYITENRNGQRLADDGVLAEHVMGEKPPQRWHGEARFTMAYPSLWNGFFVSFVAELAAGITLGGEVSENWRPVFLPAPAAARLAKGEELALAVDIVDDGSYRYSGTIRDTTWTVKSSSYR